MGTNTNYHSHEVVQVADSLETLELILEDAKSATGVFDAATTSRWLGYSEEFLGLLRDVGLKDFRRSRQFLNRFGATDRNPDFSRRSPEEMLHSARSLFLADGAVRIDDLLPSRVGNPEGFEVEGRFFTLSWLNYYCRYAYVSKFMKFGEQIVFEIGPGSGKQAELLKKAHPDLTIVLFDLPTQLYVCNQYLTKVFEGQGIVVDYIDGRSVLSPDHIQRGKINILPHWKFDLFKCFKFDLLWNAASFQEMAPDTALNYLNAASGAEAMFLMYNIKFSGMNAFPGNRGILTKKYVKRFMEVGRTPAALALTPEKWIYFDSFWTKSQ